MTAKRTTFAILSDLSAVVATADGFGAFDSELEATERLIAMLEDRNREILAHMTRAKRMARVLRIAARVNL